MGDCTARGVLSRRCRLTQGSDTHHFALPALPDAAARPLDENQSPVPAVLRTNKSPGGDAVDSTAASNAASVPFLTTSVRPSSFEGHGCRTVRGAGSAATRHFSPPP